MGPSFASLGMTFAATTGLEFNVTDRAAIVGEFGMLPRPLAARVSPARTFLKHMHVLVRGRAGRRSDVRADSAVYNRVFRIAPPGAWAGDAGDPGTERYRSGRNGGASKASCRVSGTWVRIPPSPPNSVLSFPNKLAGVLGSIARIAALSHEFMRQEFSGAAPVWQRVWQRVVDGCDVPRLACSAPTSCSHRRW